MQTLKVIKRETKKEKKRKVIYRHAFWDSFSLAPSSSVSKEFCQCFCSEQFFMLPCSHIPTFSRAGHFFSLQDGIWLPHSTLFLHNSLAYVMNAFFFFEWLIGVYFLKAEYVGYRSTFKHFCLMNEHFCFGVLSCP